MNIHRFKQTRILHKWLGLICFIFILILSVSGILLMHSDSLELEKRMIDGQFLPDKYFHVAGSHRIVQSIGVISQNEKTILFTGTDHGLFRSEDLGKNWVELKQGLFSQNVRVLTVNPENSQVIYAGTPKGIFKSEDQGESWSEWFDEASGLTNVFINDLLIDPRDTDILYAATQGGLFVSDDGGEFWDPSFIGDGTPVSRDVRTVSFSAANPGTLYIGTGKGAFKRAEGDKDWKETWSAITSDISSQVALKTDPEFIYVGTNKGLYKSFNGGLNWLKDIHPDLQEVRSLFIDSRNPSGIYLASRKGLFLSKDGGDLWQEITPDKTNIQNSEEAVTASINTILSLAGLKTRTSLLLAGSDSGLFISRDNGKIWEFIDFGALKDKLSHENFKMDLSKLVTEIHTGRFFGSYFFWLVDLSSFGLIALAFSGLSVVVYRNKMKKTKTSKKAMHEAEIDIDQKIKMVESADELAMDSQNIHDMIEHINQHLQKCKSIYSISKEKEEIEKIGQHILNLDKNMHHLMSHIDGFAQLAQDMGGNDSPPNETILRPEHGEVPDKTAKT